MLLPTSPVATRDGSGAEILAGPPPHAGCPPSTTVSPRPTPTAPALWWSSTRGPSFLLDQASPCLRRRQHGRLPPGPTPAGGLPRLGYCMDAGQFRHRRLPWSTLSRATPDIPCGHERRFRGRDPCGSSPSPLALLPHTGPTRPAWIGPSQWNPTPPPPPPPLPGLQPFRPFGSTGSLRTSNGWLILLGHTLPGLPTSHGGFTSPLYTAVTASAPLWSRPSARAGTGHVTTPPPARRDC